MPKFPSYQILSGKTSAKKKNTAIKSMVVTLILFLVLTACVPGFAKQLSNKPLSTPHPGSVRIAQNIIPPHKDAIGGGNPLQGLGRPDDPEPSRVEDYEKSLQSNDPDNQSTNTSNQSDKTDRSTATSESDNSKTEDQNEKASPKKIDENPESDPQTDKKVSTDSTGPKNKENKEEPDNSEKKKPAEKKDIDKSDAEEKTKKNPDKTKDSWHFRLQPDKSKTETLDDSPHRKALRLIKEKQYTAALTILEEEKRQNPTDTKIRYLLAVVYVLSGNNTKAGANYRYVAENASDPKLIELAKTGLDKIK